MVLLWFHGTKSSPRNGHFCEERMNAVAAIQLVGDEDMQTCSYHHAPQLERHDQARTTVYTHLNPWLHKTSEARQVEAATDDKACTVVAVVSDQSPLTY